MENPVEFLKSELENENPRIKVNAIHRIDILIYSQPNPEAIKKSLLTFLLNYSKNCSEDEVLFGLAKSLTKLTEYFKLDMIELVERLLTCEETVVRDQAIELFYKLATQLSQDDISQTLIPLLLKLRSKKKFPAKASALNAMTKIFPIVSEKEKKNLLNKIVGMISEESLILRRSLSRNMGFLCKYVNKDTLLHGFINQFKNLALDDSDSVRIICIESLVDLARVLNDEDNKSNLIPIIIQLTGDKSWKVKLHLAKSFADLAEALGKDISENSLFSIFSTLLRDLENEVRIQAVKSLKKFVKLLSMDKLLGILAYLQTLSKDTVSLVRTGVCEVVNAIFEMNQENFNSDIVKSRIQPIIIDLVNDKEIEVKIEAIKLIEPWSKYVGQGILDLLKNKTFELKLDSPNWRIRLANLEAAIGLNRVFKNEAAFDKYFRRIFLDGLNDKAFKVRETSSKEIPNLALMLPQDSMIRLCKEVVGFLNDDRLFYTFKITNLEAVELFFFAINDAETREEIIIKQTLIPFCEDKQNNLRYKALKILINIYKSNEGISYVELIRKVIEKKLNDTDRETKLLAQMQLNKN
jgi:serine/threonine-protein phosphatase 2A regulatory subunit A